MEPQKEPQKEPQPQDNPETIEPLPGVEPAAQGTSSSQETTAEPVPEVIAKDKPGLSPSQPVKKSFWQKVLPWVIVALVFYVGGLATLFFAVYQPAKQAAAAAAASAEKEITSLNSQVSQLELQNSQVQQELETTRANLVDTQDELTTAQATIEKQLAEVANANIKRLAYKLMGNINTARAALEKGDTNSARQALNFASKDLSDLQVAGLTPEALSGFSNWLNEAVANLEETTLQKSRAALDMLYTNLLLLVDNLP